MFRKMSLIAAVLMAVLAVSAFAAPVNYNINWGNEPPNMDQHLTTDTLSGQLLSLVMEGLVRYGKDGGFIMGMAEKYDVSKDGLVYTFTMKKNVTWSNGDPVTAKDFEYGIKRALDPVNASEYAYILYDIKNAQEANEGKVGLDQVGVKADGNKFVITLKGPVPYFLSILCFPTALPGNEKFITAKGADYASDAENLVYNGPYTISEWKHNDKLVLAKNPKYWDAKNRMLDTITGYMITDSGTGITMFLNKELDQVGVPGPRIQELKDKGFPVMDFGDTSVWYLQINNTNPVLKNAKIRKALGLAIDRASFVKNVIKNNSTPAMSFVAPLILGAKKNFRDEVPNTYFKDNDPAGAKVLLAEGMKELGLTKLPSFSMICDDTDRAKLFAASIQDMVSKNLGVEFLVDPMPFKARLQKVTDKDFQIVFYGWGADYNDPMTYLDLWTTDSGNNKGGYSSAAYDSLIAKAKAEPNPAKRMQMLVDAEKLLMADFPMVPIYFRMLSWTHHPNISGVIRRGVGPDPDLYWAVKK